MEANDPKIVLSVFIVGILIIISPLALYTTKVVPNREDVYFDSTMVYEHFAGLTEFRSLRPPVSSEGYVSRFENLSREGYEYFVVGSYESNYSEAAWNIIAWNFQFLKEDVARRRTYLLVDGLVPMVPAQFLSAEVTQVGWKAEEFSSGWNLGPHNFKCVNISTDDETITFTGNLTMERDIYRLSKDLPTKLSTNEYPYLVVRYKSSDGVAYFGAWNGGISIKGSWAHYSRGEWNTVFLRLPQNNMVSRVEIGFDDAIIARGGGVRGSYASGKQTVSFDYIMLASAKIVPTYVKIFLNDHLVYDEELQFLAPTGRLFLHEDVYTVNDHSYVDCVHTYRSRLTQTFIIPVDENWLTGDELVRIVTEGPVRWAISSISIKYELQYDNPIWIQFTPYIYLGLGVEFFALFIMLRKLYVWFKNM